MYVLLAVVRTAVCLACLLTLVDHAHAQAPARSAFIAEAHFTETHPRAANGQLRNVTWEIARDSSGRTRVDWGREVFIADPVSARYLQLDTEARTVQETPISQRPAANAVAPSPDVPLVAHGITAQPIDGSNIKLLGTKLIEGYLCEGRVLTRSVNVDPRHPESRVTIETEFWNASEIGPVLVITKTSQGLQQRYALKNIRSEEAPAAKFRVPAGYQRVAAAPSQLPVGVGLRK
jgi:hypothetical protein